MKMHHIGFAVKDIEKSRDYFLKLGFRPAAKVGNQNIQLDYDRNIKILFLENGFDEVMVELVQTLDDTKKSPLDFIGKAGGYGNCTPYHICYEVDDLDSAIRRLREDRFIVINPKAPTTEVLYGKEVVFLFNRSAGILELIEK